MFRKTSLAKICCCGSTFLASVVLAGLAAASVRLRDVEDLANHVLPDAGDGSRAVGWGLRPVPETGG